MSMQSITLVLLLVVGVVYSASITGRIVNGTNADIKDYPYMASVIYIISHVCGGTILNEKTILTAAHCVHGCMPTQFSVRVGSPFHTGGQQITATSVISHDQFDEETYDYDISLIKLSDSIKFGLGVAVVKLPPPKSDVVAGAIGIIAGWGTLSFNGKLPNQLQRAEVPVIDRYECQEIHDLWGSVTKRQVCAGKLGVDACQGDSGGPLIVNGEDVGIVSWGNGCAHDPTVFTRISYFIDWINANV